MTKSAAESLRAPRRSATARSGAFIGAGESVLIWRDNDEELRMWMGLLVRVGNREAALLVEFPML